MASLIDSNSHDFHEQLNSTRAEYARQLVAVATATDESKRTQAVMLCAELAQRLGRHADSDEARTRKLLQAKRHVNATNAGKVESAKNAADAELADCLLARLRDAVKLVRQTPSVNDLRRAVNTVEALFSTEAHDPSDAEAKRERVKKHLKKWKATEADVNAKADAACGDAQSLAVCQRLIDEARHDKIYNSVLRALPSK